MKITESQIKRKIANKLIITKQQLPPPLNNGYRKKTNNDGKLIIKILSEAGYKYVSVSSLRNQDTIIDNLVYKMNGNLKVFYHQKKANQIIRKNKINKLIEIINKF